MIFLNLEYLKRIQGISQKSFESFSNEKNYDYQLIQNNILITMIRTILTDYYFENAMLTKVNLYKKKINILEKLQFKRKPYLEKKKFIVQFLGIHNDLT